MSITLRRRIPLYLGFIFAFVLIYDFYFTPGKAFISPIASEFVKWGGIILQMAGLIGSISVFLLHATRVRREKKLFNKAASAWALVMFTISFSLGMLYGQASEAYLWVYDTVVANGRATVYGLMCFILLSVTWRAYRARTFESTVLMITGLFALLNNTPAATATWKGFADIGAWLLSIPSKGASLALLTGLAIGGILTGLRTILGAERGLGGITED
jgi:hypothetical protein